MRADLADIRAGVDRIDKRDQEARNQIVELEAVLDRATRRLARNASEFGAREARVEADIAELQSRIAEAARTADAAARHEREAGVRMDGRLAALERSEAMVLDRVAPTPPDDKDELWRQAQERLGRGQRDEGRRFYRLYIQRFPSDPRASQAYLAIGRSFAEEAQFPRAAAEFQKLLTVYPRAPEVPEAMWRLSRAFVRLRFCTDARALLGDLVKRYPTSAAAAEAQKEIRTLKKLPRSACTS
jgi:TolA-binding protein